MRLYHFRRRAPTSARLPAVGIHRGMPFVLDDEGCPVVELNRWLRSLPTSGVSAPNSWSAYACDLLAWLRFLHQGSVGLVDDVATLRDTVAAYHADRRMGDLARRLAPSSWTGPSSPSPGSTTGPRPSTSSVLSPSTTAPTSCAPRVRRCGSGGATWPRSATGGPTPPSVGLNPPTDT